MVDFQRRVLGNGLTVIVHEDKGSPMCAVNVLYKIGARDEDPKRTGFAHFFEHLMFSGSKHAEDFDEPLQLAGGENNAFTNCDFTNFYDVVPVSNVETALWLEADRMNDLVISSEALEIQRKVVLEEYAETCLNAPFGLTWHHLSEMVYQKYPYRWPTIGADPSHIAEASLSEVKDFFDTWYGPNNAIICLSGGITTKNGFDLVEKYFGDISPKPFVRKHYENGDKQKERKQFQSGQIVPINSIYMAWKGLDRLHEDYYAMDLLSDIFSGGRSARFFSRLIKGSRKFAGADAYVSGTVGPNMFVIEGKPSPNVSNEEAEQSFWCEIKDLQDNGVSEVEFQRQLNKVESQLKFSELSNLSKAMSLSFYETLGDAAMLNDEMTKYHKVTTSDIQRIARDLLQEDSCNVLQYQKK